MAFSRLSSALKSSNRIISLRNSFFYKQRAQSHIKDATINSDRKQIPSISWLSSLLPVALAFSAGSFAFQTHRNPSMCDSPEPDERYKSFFFTFYSFLNLMFYYGILGFFFDINLLQDLKLNQYEIWHLLRIYAWWLICYIFFFQGCELWGQR